MERIRYALPGLSFNIRRMLTRMANPGYLPCSQGGRNPARLPVDVQDLVFGDIGGEIADAQAPQFPLLDGSRPFTGTVNISKDSGDALQIGNLLAQSIRFYFDAGHSHFEVYDANQANLLEFLVDGERTDMALTHSTGGEARISAETHGLIRARNPASGAAASISSETGLVLTAGLPITVGGSPGLDQEIYIADASLYVHHLTFTKGILTGYEVS